LLQDRIYKQPYPAIGFAAMEIWGISATVWTHLFYQYFFFFSFCLDARPTGASGRAKRNKKIKANPNGSARFAAYPLSALVTTSIMINMQEFVTLLS
jgi:hypothetical protein